MEFNFMIGLKTGLFVLFLVLLSLSIVSFLLWNTNLISFGWLEIRVLIIGFICGFLFGGFVGDIFD